MKVVQSSPFKILVSYDGLTCYDVAWIGTGACQLYASINDTKTETAWDINSDGLPYCAQSIIGLTRVS
jgi:hypothetical protein